MSIINEALKKAGQTPVQEKKELPRLEPLTRRRRMNWGPVFVVSILLLITTPLLAPVFNRSYQDHSAGNAPSQANVKAQFGVEEAPLTPTTRTPSPFHGSLITPDFALNGLVYSPDGSYCLINGQVVKIGESINGAKLISVTPNGAVLEYKGERLVLSAAV